MKRSEYERLKKLLASQDDKVDPLRKLHWRQDIQRLLAAEMFKIVDDASPPESQTNE
jgi:hypothetical protein